MDGLLLDRPDTALRRRVALLLSAAALALLAWFVISTLRAAPAGAAEGPLGPVLTQVESTTQAVGVPLDLTPVDTTVDELSTNVLAPAAPVVQDTVHPLVTDTVDTVDTVASAFGPAAPLLRPVQTIVNDTFSLVAPITTTPELPTSPLPGGPGAGPGSDHTASNGNGSTGLATASALPAASPNSFASILFAERSSAAHLADTVEPRGDLPTPLDRTPSSGSPIRSVPAETGSAGAGGTTRDLPAATLVAPMLVMVMGGVLLARARRWVWTDWVALAGARPG